jgi:hypothetical protein
MSDEFAQPTTDAPQGPLHSRFVRWVLVAFGGLLLAAIIAVIVVLVLRSQHNDPLDVGIYPQVTPLAEEPGGGKAYTHRQYLTRDPIEEVVAYYAGRDGLSCQRFLQNQQYDPDTGQYDYVRCIRSETWLDMTQLVIVTISKQEFEFVGDDGTYLADAVMIDIQREWGN